MATQLARRAFTGKASTARVSRARSVRVQAADVPANVKEARQWIDNWKNKKAAQANRTSWFPGSKLPDHLDGTLPADFGFDPLGLGKEEAKLKWYVQAELQNGRWAMLGVAGILLPELASKIGVSWPGAGVAWYDAGKFEYFTDARTLFGIQMLLFAWVEILRYQDMVNPGSVNQDPIFTNNKLENNAPGYPGFDPFSYSKSPDFETYKLKELKNGRLAMLAFAGIVVQSYTTGTTPLNNLAAHLASPFTTTVWQNELARL